MANIYPIGVQSFAKLREEGYIYVDKTGFIEKLVTEGNCYFLSRPRRFGKSLLLSTIEAFYLGRKDLFEGLAISHMDHDWQPYPVLHMALNAWEYKDSDSLSQKLSYDFERWEHLYGMEKQSAAHSERFRYIIEQAYAKTGHRVVILIDEYDKPLLDTADDRELQDSYRSLLKSVYGNLKNCDQYIEFAMLTGVSRFGKLSIFSDLNNLQDISLDDEYSAICGITVEEIRENFSEGVRELAERNGITIEEAYAQLKENYDGYHFSPYSPDMYNPFSLLKALYDRNIGSYWFSTDIPTFLADMIRSIEDELQDSETLVESIDDLMDGSYDLDNILSLMYQRGLLTIKSYDTRFHTVFLGYPNREVERGIHDICCRSVPMDARS